MAQFINDPKHLTQIILKNILDYDCKTGQFTWKQDRNQFILKGHKAGQANKEGYIRINISGRKTYAHRLAWLWVYGNWPDGEIDHINENTSDNSIDNLRVVTRSFNILRHKRRSNKTNDLPIGITQHKQTGKYWVRFRQKSYGLFSTLEEAEEARKKAINE